MRERTFTTGLIPATPSDLFHLADAAEHWQRGDLSAARDLEARICAALLSHQGWEYVAPRPHVPARREGRKIVERERPYIGPRIARSYRYENGAGSEETPAPQILTDIGQAFGLLRTYVLLHLSDISADGLPMAHVGGGKDMLADGKAMGGSTLAATLVAAILRCEAMDREQKT